MTDHKPSAISDEDPQSVAPTLTHSPEVTMMNFNDPIVARVMSNSSIKLMEEGEII